MEEVAESIQVVEVVELDVILPGRT